jgi:hypothetical protein
MWLGSQQGDAAGEAALPQACRHFTARMAGAHNYHICMLSHYTLRDAAS